MCDMKQVLSTPDWTTVVKEYTLEKGSVGFQTEADLEQAFINKLVREHGYEYLDVHDEPGLLQNLRKQIQELNAVMFSDSEWDRFFNARFMNKTKIQKAHVIQDGTTKENFIFDDGHEENLLLIDKQDLLHNKLQVLNQYAVAGKRSNRYDVTVLVNGIPILHCELKRRGRDLEEAYRQISRYEEQSFWSGCGLYEFVQIFVISNGTLTRYYGNSVRRALVNQQRDSGFELTNRWADGKNRAIEDLMDFTRTFMSRRTLLSILTRYCVLDTDDNLRILRPYQIMACEAIINKVKNELGMGHYGAKCGGYIWHTTGSGKTLTSFKAAQLVTQLPEIDKVLFIVDRNDLDSQTVQEYKRFSGAGADEDFVSETTKTTALDQSLKNDASKIVITTIQKLDNFVKKYKNHPAYSKKVVMIFDECHRTQFGDMHRRITTAFKKYFAFGFTGTPIFEENAVSVTATMLARKTTGITGGTIQTTTGMLFGACLHKYLITNAIDDGTVLKFKLSYTNTAAREAEIHDRYAGGADFERTAMRWERIEQNCRYIMKNFCVKTHHFQGVKFNSLLATESVDAACRYYAMLKRMNADSGLDLKIGIIYHYGANDNELYADNWQPGYESELQMSKEDFLESAMRDYNAIFGTSFDLTCTKLYKDDVSRRMKNMRDQDEMLDMLIVVDMFLTGFDSPRINTLWVDKKLQDHSLLQAFSRTNRRCGKTKDCGQIVCFRNLRDEVNHTLSLFTDEEGGRVLFIRPYDSYYNGYTEDNGTYHHGYKELTERVLNDFSIQHLTQDTLGEKEKAEFVTVFGQLLLLRNLLATFDEFAGNEIMDPGKFDDYKGWYLRIHDDFNRGRNVNGKDVLDGLVFHVDLIEESVMNIDEILMRIQNRVEDEKEPLDFDFMQKVQRQVDASPMLRTKLDLIKQFMNQVNNGSSSSTEEFNRMVQANFEQRTADLIGKYNLKDGAAEFITDCVFDRDVKDIGDDLDRILPPMSRFGGQRAKVRDEIFRQITDMVSMFGGLLHETA